MSRNDSAGGSKSRRLEAPPRVSKAALKDFLDRVTALAEPVAADLGLELVLARSLMEGGRPLLRLFIDRPPVDGVESVVTLDDCAAVSRGLDEALEADGGPQIDDYLLEVSSPGLDRPLVREADFFRFQGRLVKIKLRRDGRTAAHQGRLALDPAGGLALETDSGRLDFTYDQVVSGRLSLDEIIF